MRKVLLLGFALLFALCNVALAQSRAISGKVLAAENGQPLPGVNVVVKGTTTGTFTAADGSYKINVPSDNAVLVISFLGFATQEVGIAGRSKIDVLLKEDSKILSEAVVIGYGIQEKKDISGSVAQVKGKEIENLPMQSFDRAIQGRLAGVQVTSSNGIPGGAVQIRIRGTGSINASNDPLYIIDGVQVNSGDKSRSLTSSNALAGLNPNDIESIDVLKDAASASIYGAQAANGVVIITTKRGKAGKTKFNFGAYAGTTEVIRKLNLLTGPEFVQLGLEAYEHRYGKASATYQSALATWGNPENTATYDWQDAVFRKGFVHNYDLSASGGNDNTKFYVATSFNKQEGQVINSDFERGTMRINLEHKVSDKLSFSNNLNMSTFTQHGVSSGGAFSNPYRSAILMAPNNPIYNENGSYFSNFFGAYNNNVVMTANYDVNDGTTNQVVGSVSANYDIIPGLRFKSSFNLDYSDINENRFYDPRTNDGGSVQGRASALNTRNINWQTDQTLNFNKIVNGRHSIGALAGVSYRNDVRTTITAEGTGVPSYQFKTLQSTAVPTSVSSNFTQFKLAGMFGRINYTFDDKYIFSATTRYDGSSRFGDNNKFGVFPAGSVAWRVSNEQFMKSLSFIEDLKLRASYGITGNQGISNFASKALFGNAGEYAGLSGAAPSQLGSPNLTWEENRSANFGIDYTILGGRIRGSADYFISNRERLLLSKPLPATSGFTSFQQNVGTVQNKGLELELNTVNVDAGGFKWETNFNITFIKNEVKKLLEGQNQIGTSIKIGEPINSIFTYRYAGVNPADGRAMWLDTLGNITYNLAARDRVYIGSSNPKYFGGLSNTVSFKGFELTAFLQFNVGNLVYFSDGTFLMRSGSTFDRNQSAEMMNRWQKPGDMTSVPKPFFGGTVTGNSSQYALSDRFYQDGSYIRLKQLTLAYNLPKVYVQAIKLTNARIYAQGVNMWTYTKYTGFDPEVTDSDFGIYPQGKNYTLGVQLSF
jgi:TonB-dependent starch-binding outer membrane protein SusC